MIFYIFIVILILFLILYVYVKVSNFFHAKENNKPRNEILDELIASEKTPELRAKYIVERKGYLPILEELILLVHHSKLVKHGNHLHEPKKEYSVGDFHFFLNLPSDTFPDSIKLSFSREAFPEIDVKYYFSKDKPFHIAEYFSVTKLIYSEEFDKNMDYLFSLIHPLAREIKAEQYREQKAIEQSIKLAKEKEIESRYSGF